MGRWGHQAIDPLSQRPMDSWTGQKDMCLPMLDTQPFPGWWFGTWISWLSIYIYIGNNDPNWLSYIFHRGRAQPPSSFSWISQIATGHGFVWKIDVKNHPMAISMGNMMISTLHLPQGAPCWRRAIPGCLRKPVIPGLWCLPQSFFR